MFHFFFSYVVQSFSTEQRIASEHVRNIFHIVSLDGAFKIEFSHTLNYLLVLLLAGLVDKADDDSVRRGYLSLEKWFRAVLFPSFGRDDSHDWM